MATVALAVTVAVTPYYKHARACSESHAHTILNILAILDKKKNICVGGLAV